MDQIEHAEQVHVHRVGEGLRGQARGERADAGVGDHDVEMPELGDALVDRGRQRHAVAHVGDRGEGALPFLLDQSRGLVEILRPGQRILVGLDVRAQVHRDDVGPLRGEHPCVRTPLTARGSADHGHLARHPAHSPSFVSVLTFRP